MKRKNILVRFGKKKKKKIIEKMEENMKENGKEIGSIKKIDRNGRMLRNINRKGEGNMIERELRIIDRRGKLRRIGRNRRGWRNDEIEVIRWGKRRIENGVNMGKKKIGLIERKKLGSLSKMVDIGKYIWMILRSNIFDIRKGKREKEKIKKIDNGEIEEWRKRIDDREWIGKKFGWGLKGGKG